MDNFPGDSLSDTITLLTVGHFNAHHLSQHNATQPYQILCLNRVVVNFLPKVRLAWFSSCVRNTILPATIRLFL